jgi:hypothetical protein
MKTEHTMWLTLIVFMLLAWTELLAQTVNITITANTATCMDTLSPNGIVILCGSSGKGTTPAITWDTATGIRFTNAGGDYWKTTFQAKTGDTVLFKFVTYLSDFKHSTFHWSGWDGDFTTPSKNRMVIVGSRDTTLPLQYFNPYDTQVAQYWKPFQDAQDTVSVYFRVNMGGVASFDPSSQTPEVDGSAPLGASPSWVKFITLTRETGSVNNGSFWSGVAKAAKSSVTAGALQEYKFVINGSTWENIGNRSFTFSSNVITASDTTISWAYFNNQPPTGPPINSTINFRLKLDALERAGLFNRGKGDKIAVTGVNGWPPSTFDFDTEPTMLKLTFVPSIQEWVLSQPETMTAGTQIVYKYFIDWDSTRIDSTNPNFIRGLLLANGWEEPGVVGGGNRTYNFQALSTQTVPGDFGAEQQFFNSLHPNSVIPSSIQLTFNVDMTPAANVTTNPTNTLFRPGIDTVYIQFDGCMIPITQGKTMYGTDNRIMLTSPGSNGIYTGTINLKGPTFYQVCYRIVYTSTTGEVENGGGTNIGRRYYQYIVPTNVSGSNVTWPASFNLALVSWMQNNLTVETPPDLGTIGAVGDNNSVLPAKYELMQNYPNPFNPSTVITYSVSKLGNVKIEVYNILGKKVATLVNQNQFAGTHSLVWNSQNDNGSKVTSGVYFIRMQAGSFTQIKKMVLLK